MLFKKSRSRKGMDVCAKSLQSCPILCGPMDCSPLASSGGLPRFSRQEHWIGLRSSPGDLPDTGTEPTSLMSPTLAGGFFTTSTTWGAPEKGRTEG